VSVASRPALPAPTGDGYRPVIRLATRPLTRAAAPAPLLGGRTSP